MPGINTLRYALASLVCWIGVSPAVAGQYFISSAADTWIDAVFPAQTHGSDPELRSVDVPTSSKHPLYRFDVSGLPPTSVVTSATMELWITQSGAVSQPVVVHVVTSAWSEPGATWNSHGSAFDSSTVHGTFFPDANGPISVDITGLVQQWVNGTSTNHGVTFVSTPVRGQTRFTAREWASVLERPTLTVNTAGPQLGVADLSLTKAVNDSTPNETDAVTFLVGLENLGPNAATGVQINDQLPSGVTYLSHSASQGIYNPATGAWNVGGLVAGANETLSIDVSVDLGTSGFTITNTASVGALNEVDPNGGNNVAVARIYVDASDLSVTKVVDDSTPDPNQAVTFTVTVSNAGPVDASGVEILDLLPPDLSYQFSVPDQGSYSSGSGIWTVGDLSQGTAVDLDIVALVADEPGSETLINLAQVSAADQADPAAGNNADSVSVTVNGNDLQVTCGADVTDPHEGDPVVLSVTLHNLGGGTTSGVLVTDVVPSGLTYLSDSTSQGSYDAGAGTWTVGPLGGGAVAELFLGTTVDAGTAGSTIQNVAGISSGGSRSDPVPGNDADSVNVSVQAADLAISKTVDDPSPNEGDGFRYRVVVKNLGPDDASGVEVADPLPAGVSYASDSTGQGAYDPGTGLWSVGSLVAGDSASLFLDAWVDPGTAGSTITNTAAVSGSSPTDPSPGNDADSVAVSIPAADLEILKGVDQPTPLEGQAVTFLVGVTNHGPDGGTGVRVTDPVPAGLSYASDSTSQGAYDTGTGVWDVGSLAAGDSAALFLTATVDSGNAGSTIVNVASGSADQGDPAPADNVDSASVSVPLVNVGLVKIVDEPDPAEGDWIEFTITATNGGDAATGLQVTDVLPAGLTHQGHVPSGTTTYDPGTGVWNIGNLPGAAMEDLRITASVDAGTAGSVILNTASVTALDQADSDATNDSASQGVTVRSADIAVSKVVDDPAPTELDTITYTVLVWNEGPDPADVEITDPVPAGLKRLGHSASQGNYAPGTGTWSVNVLAPGDTASLTLDCEVNAGTGGTVITNTASLSSSNPSDPVSANDVSSVDIDVQASDLTVTKTVNNPAPSEGGTVTFTVKVHNAGPDPTASVTVKDSLPAGLSYQSAAPGLGSYNPATGLWTFGALAAADSATLFLVATVDSGVGGSSITNIASRQASDPVDGNSFNDADSAAVTVAPGAPTTADLALQKAVDTSAPDEADPVQFTVTLTNAGPDSALGVEVADLLPPGLSYVSDGPSRGSYDAGSGVWSIGSVATVDTLTLDLLATVDPQTAGDVIVNTASVSASNQADPSPANNTASDSVTVRAADVVVSQFLGPGEVNEGDTITLSVSAQNQGPDDAIGLEITDTLPVGLTYSSDSTSQGFYDVGSGAWTIGSLGPSASALLDLTATVDAGTAGTVLPNVAWTSAADRGDPDAANNADTLMVPVAAVDIVLVKTVNDSTPDEGDTFRFTVAVSNSGPDGADGLEVTDVLPPGVTYQFHLRSQGSYSDSTGIWNVGTVDPGDGAWLALWVRADSGTAGQTIWNHAQVSGTTQADTNSANDADSVSVRVREADLNVDKVVDNPAPLPGEAVRFDVILTNVGPDAVGSVSVLDQLPAGLTFQTDSLSQGSYDSGTGVWTAGALAAGDSATLAVVALVDSGTAGQTIWNTASVSTSDTGDPFPANNADSASVTVSQGVHVTGVQPTSVVRPGELDAHLFTLDIASSEPSTVTLQQIRFDNATTGPGSRAELDAELGVLTLLQDDGDSVFEPGQDFPLAQSSAQSGTLTFNGIVLGVPSGGAVKLFVGADVGLSARDGDLLDLALPGPSALVMTPSPNYTSSWPVAPSGDATVDGMAEAQIALGALPPGNPQAGSAGILVLDAIVPGNGYEADTLEEIEAANAGSAQPGTDVAAVDLWADGGDGVFDAGSGDDVLLGSPTGAPAPARSGSWRLTGLSAPIPAGGLRVFVSADLSPGAVPGRTLQFEIPSSPLGVVVASGNDGPVDGPARSSTTYTVQPPPSVVAITAGQSGRTLLPGAPTNEIFRMKLVNNGAKPETLQAFTITNSTQGPGTQAQLDAEWAQVALTVETRADHIGGVGLGKLGSFSGGRLTFSSLDLEIADGDSVALVVEGTAALAARDGDVLDVEVTGAGDFVFADSTAQPTPAVWPIAPPAGFPVNGMSRAQITPLGGLQPQLLTGSAHNLSLIFHVRPNGYEPDTLRYVNVKNGGNNPAQGGIDIARVDLWHDLDGDGVPEPDGDDAAGHLGLMVDTGNRWEVTGLVHALPIGGSVLFLTTDIAAQATPSAIVRLALPTSPDFGLGVDTGNDGPVDKDFVSPTAQTITEADRVTLSVVTVAPGTAAPGAVGIPVLHLQATNSYSVPKTLTGLSVTNRTQGPGQTSDLDGEAGLLRVWADSVGGSPLASGVYSSGEVSLSTFSMDLLPDETRDLLVTCDPSLTLAADGDVIGAELTDATDVSFSDPTTVVAGFPLDSQAAWTIDGMVAGQVQNHGALPTTLGPGEGPALALDVTLPANGYAADVLQGITVVNDSTALPGDIDQIRLWRDGSDGAFDAGSGDDIDLGAMSPGSGTWVSALLTDPVPPGGARYFVSVNSSPALVDGRTVKLAIPTGGATMESGNDGPTDARIENPETITLSTAALLADLVVLPDKSTLGDSTVTATMTVRNVGDSTIVGITPTSLTPDVPGILTQIAGPVPDSLSLATGAEESFVWTFRADSAGAVRMSGAASGTEVGTLLTRTSPTAGSNTHRVFLSAQDLEVFPVESMPFSVTQGQAGVVPLSLTLTNQSPEGGSDIRITGLGFRLEDGTGAGIIPVDLLSRVVVNEGTNIYLNKTALETSGDSVDLTLTTEVLVPADSAQVTLSLSLDISDSTTVPDFRVQIPDGTWIDAEDATSGAPVTLTLAPGSSYPIQSGLARVVSEATRLDVAAVSGSDATAGQGQAGVHLLKLSMLNPDPDSLAADVRLSSFEVILTDTSGVAIPQPSLHLDRIRVLAPFQTLLDRAVTSSEDSTVSLVLSPLLSVPVNAPVEIFIEADLDPLAPLGPVRLRLADSTSFDARDANTGSSVPAVYATDPVEGPTVTIVAPADTMFAAGRPMLPAALPVGTQAEPALRAVLRHPGGVQTGPIRLDSVTLRCRDHADHPLVPLTFVDRVEAFLQGASIGVVTDPPGSGGEIVLALGGATLQPGSVDSVEIRVDIQVTAPASLFRLDVAAGGIAATDVNLSVPVAVAADSGAVFPLTSGLTQLESPARDLVVDFQDTMPAVLVADGMAIAFATVTLDNPALPTAGGIEVDHLIVRAADPQLAPVALGVHVSRVQAWVDGLLWAESAELSAADATAMLAPATALVVAPGQPRSVALRAVTRQDAGQSGMRLGLEKDDVGVVQPPSQLLTIAVQPAEGKTFPYWTQSGNFSPRSLEESWSNFPNPFAAGRGQTSFAFFLPKPGRVSLKVWTPRGKAVKTLLEAVPLPAGLHQDRAWDGRNGLGEVVTNGVYLAEIAVLFDDGTSARHLRKVAVVR